jgi:uncharacterized linocin/CFP29 family protein
MDELLMRDATPFGDEVWAAIDGMVVEVLKKTLVGRRVLEMVGPLGWGVEQAPLFSFASNGIAVAEVSGYLQLQELREEFMIRAKHLAIASHTPFQLDLGAVAIAATRLAYQEDTLILEELMQKAALTGDLGNWDEPNGPFSTIANVVAQFEQEGMGGRYGVAGPYVMILSPMMYARLASLVYGQGLGRRELDMVENLLGGGIYTTTRMPDNKVLLLSPQPWNMDLVVGQDAVTASLGNEGIDHFFLLFETLALRVKRPEAIFVLS